jgi:hypothetical protein
MLTPSDALRQILGRVTPLGRIETVALDSAVGRVLAGEVRSDVDLPPFDKSAMDGFAVRAADLEPALAPGGERVLVVAGESRAGAPYDGPVPPGACVAIYTGAEVPRDCDAVVIVELAVIPLIFGAYVTALVISLANLLVLRHRVAVEEEAGVALGDGGQLRYVLRRGHAEILLA